MRTVMSTQSSVGKLPPIPCNGWCYTEAEEDIVYDYAWTIERFSRHAVNFRTGKCKMNPCTIFRKKNLFLKITFYRQNHVF